MLTVIHIMQFAGVNRAVLHSKCNGFGSLGLEIDRRHKGLGFKQGLILMNYQKPLGWTIELGQNS